MNDELRLAIGIYMFVFSVFVVICLVVYGFFTMIKHLKQRITDWLDRYYAWLLGE